MQLQNKNKIAFLAALALLLSYAETILPRFIPFLRLGLANTIILIALEMNFSSFMLLTAVKTLASSMMSGILFSPFFIMSASQSFASALLMFALFRIKGKWLSLYGISLLGSALSSLIQIAISTLYLGPGVTKLAAPLLFFSSFSGLVTAFLAYKIKINNNIPLADSEFEKNTKQKSIPKIIIFFLAILIILLAAATFAIKNLWILLTAFVLSLIFQIISGRKFFILPHIFLWIFVIITSIFIPEGKVLFSIGSFSITQEALLNGIIKALRLSIAANLSQCAAALPLPKTNLLGLSFFYYRQLLDKFRESKEKNIFKRLQESLEN
ncbi:MAG: Gx transporter family protein [Treponema sp.]|nr:Gx transporter family protein [Treponema sp.]